MKNFLLKTFLFCFLIFAIIVLGFFLPATPRDKQSLLFSQKVKDSLLEKTLSPRIIFVGGSNLSMGINSEIIKNKLKLNPINTSIHASIGLVYMMDHTLKYVKSGDVIVISAEYQQFYDHFAYGRDELLRLIADSNKKEFLDLRLPQMINIYKYIPSFCLSKFKFQEYIFDKKDLVSYGVNGYNKYGDYSQHWELEPSSAKMDSSIGLIYNDKIIKYIEEFEKKIKLKNAKLYITFPGFQSSSFEINKKEINFIYHSLIKKRFNVLGNPLRYKMPDNLMFGTTYHLSKKAVDMRTNLFIQDFQYNN